MRIISKNKINELREKLKEKKVDALLLLNSAPIHDSSIEYLTGFRQERNQAFSCLIFKKEKSVLIVSSLDYDQACAEAMVDEIICIKKSRFGKILKETLGKSKNLGICESIFPVSMAKRIRKHFIDVEDILLNMRAVKEPKEIYLIEKSCSITNHGINVIEKELAKTKNCRELVINLEAELMRRGADELAFSTLMTSGKRGLWVHPYPSVACEKIGNLGLVDFGARVKGYCSDVTVPFVKGGLNNFQKKMLATVKQAYSRSVEKLETGIGASEIFETADSIIVNNGFVFKHSLGHGIGLDVHEYPNLSPKPRDKKLLEKWKETELKENMVFTIEPGIYTHQGGLRLENDFLLTRKGPRQLTRSRVLES
jgi:Xaa-Pro aminopeptidase